MLSGSCMTWGIFRPSLFFSTGGVIRVIPCLTSFKSNSFLSWGSGFNLFLMCRFCLLLLISSILFIAFTVLLQSSLLYLTGTCLFFSNSKVVSIASSLPAAFLKAFVHLVLRGFRLSLKFLWHFERQNLNILQSFLTNTMPCPGYILETWTQC